MKDFCIVIVVAFSIILVGGANAGQFGKGDHFIGLWQGIDPTDGSEMLRSITKNSDGTYAIIGNESYFVGCGGDRGKVVGTGVLDGKVMVSADFTLICFGDDYFDEGDDVYYPAPMEIVWDRFNRTIVEQYESSAFSPAVLHRISKR